jgi:DNA polymerase-2
LLRTAHIAERRGFENIHGIVDCLWLRKPGITEEDCLELCLEVEKDTGLPISFEGIYRWIVFLSSKTNRNMPVLNRYFGVFRDGKIKVRGIAARRSDTPKLVRDAQLEMIDVLAKAETREEIPPFLPEAIHVLRRYVDCLKTRSVGLEELVITTRLSKAPKEYDRSLLQGIAAKQLAREGVRVHAGEKVQYLIRDAYNSNPDLRVTPLLLLNSRMCYDVRKYLEMLINAADTVLGPFGLTKEEIQHAVEGHKQTLLSA